MYGPQTEYGNAVHQMKYRGEGEDFETAMTRVADGLKDNQDHYHAIRDIMLHQRFMGGGRIQSAIGSPRLVTAFNCFVSATIHDSMDGIMDAAKNAARTMRLGGGIGYDFSSLRPRNALIRSLDSRSSGPVSFMAIFDAVCQTIASAGHRRGAQMGVLRVDHPDIEEFVEAKANHDKLTNFNVSVGVTDKFMEAVINDTTFDLVFDGVVYRTIRARPLWEKILRTTWDWAEPGVLFIDRMNQKNNLWYCEIIASTNPCGEQPLPPDGACLLGSFNLTKYLIKLKRYHDDPGYWGFNYAQFKADIPHIIRAMDNVIDRTIYPLKAQEIEAKNKRRMGIGVTGVANTLEAMGFPYGSKEFLKELENILRVLRDEAYRASIELAKEKGAFPLFNVKLLDSGFAKTLPGDIRDGIARYGLRNSHLLSIAPTGTISFSADNISSGIEPVFSFEMDRPVGTPEGKVMMHVTDWAYRELGIKGKPSSEVTIQEHVDVLNLASRYVDSACSKTCNIGDSVTWEEFKDVYMQAYLGGASGCTTFRAKGKRFSLLQSSENVEEDVTTVDSEKDFVSEKEEGGACYYDPELGVRTCDAA